MWPPWGKPSSSKLRSGNATTTRPSFSNSNFRCSSFKDIQFLCSSEDPDSYHTHLRCSPSSSSSSSSPRNSTVFHRVRAATSILRQWPGRTFTPNRSLSPKPPSVPDPPPTTLPDADNHHPPVCFSIPDSESAIVVYTTSLRVVRPTFEACRSVQSILSGFRVSIDERDVSMDPRFMEELHSILAGTEDRVTLPRVFIGGRYVGGAEEVKQLHEIGELKRLVEGLPTVEARACEMCGGFRFILCDACRGSHKVYSEKGGFRSCVACNHNGLIRCPRCCPPMMLVSTVRLE